MEGPLGGVPRAAAPVLIDMYVDITTIQSVWGYGYEKD